MIKRRKRIEKRKWRYFDFGVEGSYLVYIYKQTQSIAKSRNIKLVVEAL